MCLYFRDPVQAFPLDVELRADLLAYLKDLLLRQDIKHNEEISESVFHARTGQILFGASQIGDLRWSNQAAADQERCQQLIRAEELKQKGKLSQLKVDLNIREHFLDPTQCV
jgi:hypothetical protein